MDAFPVGRKRGAILMAGAFAVACSREVSRLEPVQKMAYDVKPAIVRVNAFAVARFHCPASALRKAAQELSADGYRVALKADIPQSVTAETGAGGSGSGFIVHPEGYLLTSGHVIQPTLDTASMNRELLRNGATKVLLDFFPAEVLRKIYREGELKTYLDILAAEGSVDAVKITNEVELSNGDRSSFRILQYSPPLSARGNDVAVLKIEGKNLPTVRIGNSDSVRLQESIWVIGYPAVASTNDEVIGGWLSRDSDLEATFNPGTITSIKRDVMRTPVLQTNAAMYRGNSGGPAVNRDGEVIAISTWGHTEAEQIKFLVPINVARPILAAAHVPLGVEGEFQRTYRLALDEAWSGEWMAARRDLKKADQLFPSSPDLIRFMNDADAATRALPYWKRHPLVLAPLWITLAAVIVSSVVIVSRRTAAKPVRAVATVTPDGRGGDEMRQADGRQLGLFTILNGSRAGEKLGLGGSGIRIGRESSVCEIVLENPKVSRLHAEIVAIDGKVLLIDRNSSNGTYVNDEKIDRRFLQDGDIIYFGGRNAIAVAYHV
jgi:serine protease Do